MSEIFSKILKDKNGSVLNVGSKYKQPDWGADMAIVEVLPETNFTIVSEGEQMAAITQEISLVADAEYTFVYNGTEYKCTTMDNGEGTIVFGNLAADGGEDTGEPFFGGVFYDEEVIVTNGFYGLIIALDGSTSVTLSIKGPSNEIHAIPKKYVEHAPTAPMMVGVIVADTGFVYSDTPFDKIVQAVREGRNVYMGLETAVYPLSYINETAIRFTGMISINDNNCKILAIEIYQNEAGDTLASSYTKTIHFTS